MIDILKHTNVISTLFAEVRNGRYSALGDYLYLNAQGGTGEMSGLVSKVDVSLQQFIGEFFGSYRLIEEPHGWLDLLGGFRFTYLGEQVGLQANNMAIGVASTNLVDQFAQQLATPNRIFKIWSNSTSSMSYPSSRVLMGRCQWLPSPAGNLGRSGI